MNRYATGCFVLASLAVPHAAHGYGEVPKWPQGNTLIATELEGPGLDGVELRAAEIAELELADGTRVSARVRRSTIEASYADAPGSTCAHSELVPGDALFVACSPCAQRVYAAEPNCVTTLRWNPDAAWDAACVRLARNLCPLPPSELTGATFHVPTSDGDAVALRIDGHAVAPDPTPSYRWVYGRGGWYLTNVSNNEDADVVYYRLRYDANQRAPGAAPAWRNICPTDGPLGHDMAILAEGAWNTCEGAPGCGAKTSERGHTLACRGADAIAKCIHPMGYKPWQDPYVCNADETTCRRESVADYHQACTRMMRSDYCGHGVGLTVDGTLIQAGDGLDINRIGGIDDVQWGLEAGWGPDGATCLNRHRFWGTTIDANNQARLDYVHATCPDVPVNELDNCTTEMRDDGTRPSLLIDFSSAFGHEGGWDDTGPSDPPTGPPAPIPVEPVGGIAL